MADSKQAITSLLTEHFRYTPLTLLDDIINTVNELVYRAVNAVEEGLSNAAPSSLGFEDRFAAEHPNTSPDLDDEGNPIFPEAQIEIENGVHQLETLLQASVDKNFDKLEIYVLRNILSVPQDIAPWIRLGHYDNLGFPPQIQSQNSETKELLTPDSLYLLRKKLIETRKLHALLELEQSRNAALLRRLESLLLSPTEHPASTDPPQPSLAFLVSTPAANSLDVSLTPGPKTPLTIHTRSVASQLPGLRQALSTLKSQAAAIRGEDGGFQHPSNAALTERREYIEGRVKKRLEEEGLDLQTGNSRDGTVGNMNMGKPRQEEEVADIERVAELVSTRLEASQHESGQDMEIDE